MSPNITLVTSNPNKVKDISLLLGVELERSGIELTEIQTTDVAEVAKHKAIEAYEKLQKPVLVDDAALTIEQWGALPGALIKYFVVEVGCDGIIEMLGGAENRNCYAETAMAYCDKDGPQVFMGRVDGTISHEVRGTNGWGYDVIFIPNGETQTCAEMTSDAYWKYSARNRAADVLKRALKTRN